MQKLKLTNVAIEKLNKVIELKKQKLRELGQYKASAAENEGDAWHDNFAFEQAEIRERGLLREIAELQNDLNEAEIVEHKPDTSGQVTLGSQVTVSIKYDDEDVEEETYTITGGSGDITQNLISENSPLAMCIMGKREGFEGSYSVKNSTTVVKILKVN